MGKKFVTGLKRHKVSLLFATPFLLLFLLFTVIPVISAFVLSFTRYDIIQPARVAGIKNYLTLFLKDEVFMIAGKNTMLFAMVLAPATLLASLLIAWMINSFSRGVRTFLVFVFYAPSLSGAVSAIWMIIFSGDVYGFANDMLSKLNLIAEPVQWLSDPKYAFLMVFIATMWSSLGTGFLSLIAGFRGIDASLYEAAAMDGIKNRVQELWYITLPVLRPQLMFAALMSITSAFGIGEICNTLFGFPSPNYSAHTIVLHMTDYANTRLDFGTACAMATILFFMMVLTNKLVNMFIARVGK